MLIETVKAVLLAGVPMAIITLLIVRVAIERGAVDDGGVDGHSLATKESLADRGGFLYSKWARFGGGFYGIMALITYAHVEINEIWDAISSAGGVISFLTSLSIGLLVDMFVEGLMNFVVAITWFTYWDDVFTMTQPWIWLAAAYVGYNAGVRLAASRYSLQGVS
ncbi:MAG: hypothetical protein DHS20C11_33790 [Lysobacteraceae bacterium]|nr:MAG: hypothetical protein DHS20C11_33790 [Xanthomonadaceae bacterium]